MQYKWRQPTSDQLLKPVRRQEHTIILSIYLQTSAKRYFQQIRSVRRCSKYIGCRASKRRLYRFKASVACRVIPATGWFNTASSRVRPSVSQRTFAQRSWRLTNYQTSEKRVGISVCRRKENGKKYTWPHLNGVSPALVSIQLNPPACRLPTSSSKLAMTTQNNTTLYVCVCCCSFTINWLRSFKCLFLCSCRSGC